MPKGLVMNESQGRMVKRVAAPLTSLVRVTGFAVADVCMSVVRDIWTDDAVIQGMIDLFRFVLQESDRRTLAVRVRTSCAARPALAAATEALLQAREPVIAEIDKLETLLISIARRDETCHRLMTAQCVGPIVGPAFLSSVDDGRRFPKAREVGAYFGLTPRRHQSEEIDYQGLISKGATGWSEPCCMKRPPSF